MEFLDKEKFSEFIKQNIKLFEQFDSVYLFGSILDFNLVPNDIDILLIYSKYSNEIITSSILIHTILEEKSGLPIDLTVLSSIEEQETKFLKKINSKYLKLK